MLQMKKDMLSRDLKRQSFLTEVQVVFCSFPLFYSFSFLTGLK